MTIDHTFDRPALRRVVQEHEQPRAGILAVTSLQSAVTFPDVVGETLEHADRYGQSLYRLDLGALAASDEAESVLIDDEPSADDWARLEKQHA